MSTRKTVASTLIAAAFVTAAAFSSAVSALEYPIGEPQKKSGLEIAAVYLQPIEMAPAGLMKKAAESDIHIEADIHALADNANGFEEGAWVPYLDIKYEISKVGSDFKLKGEFMPMVANDGPHYGDNVKLSGPGKYKVKYTISPPNEHSHFGRHTDRETGVGEWFKTFVVEYEFTYAGIGKKGGY
ncbi:MAG: iron transporter [Zoogloeaceae bacterium]|nr:iron transporter [Zoogloeaceae bacterium]